jgi:hypothetical protein
MGLMMTTSVPASCRKHPCANAIPSSLASEQLCLDHFLDEACIRTDQALERCRAGQPIDSPGVEAMLADALVIVNHLDGQPDPRSDRQRDRMLELLLSLANLHEYVAHISSQTMRPA